MDRRRYIQTYIEAKNVFTTSELELIRFWNMVLFRVRLGVGGQGYIALPISILLAEARRAKSSPSHGSGV